MYNEEEEIHLLITKQRFPHANMRVRDPLVKANALIDAHFSRLPIICMNLADSWGWYQGNVCCCCLLVPWKLFQW